MRRPMRSIYAMNLNDPRKHGAVINGPDKVRGNLGLLGLVGHGLSIEGNLNYTELSLHVQCIKTTLVTNKIMIFIHTYIVFI